MKKVKYFAFICISIVCFLSCEKEKEDESPEMSKNSHRVKQITDYSNDIEQSGVIFTYEGEQLVRIMEYEIVQGIAHETKKTEITYQGENAVATIYSMYNNGWISHTQNSYTISHGVVQEITSRAFDPFDNLWEIESVTEYEYSGSDLVLSQTSISDNSASL